MRFAKHFRRRATDETAVTRKPRDFYLVVGAGLFLLGLLCSFYLTFPDAVLRQRLVSELETRLPIQVDLVEATLRPLLTLTGEQMTVRLLGQSETLFHIDSFKIDPRWVSLLAGDPGLEGEINSSSGELTFVSLRSGQLDMTGTDLPFDVPLATSPPMRVAGILISGQVTTSAPLQSATESRIDIDLEQVAVQGLEALTTDAAGLRLGKLSLQMTGQGPSFSIVRLETTGGDLMISGKGTLMLASSKPQNSRINLNLSVRVDKQVNPTLASLLELVGTQQSDGSRKLRLTGTLAKPVIR